MSKHRHTWTADEITAVYSAVKALDRSHSSIIPIDRVAAKANAHGTALRTALLLLEEEDHINLMIAQNRTEAEKQYRHGWYDPNRGGYIAYVGLR